MGPTKESNEKLLRQGNSTNSLGTRLMEMSCLLRENQRAEIYSIKSKYSVCCKQVSKT